MMAYNNHANIHVMSALDGWTKVNKSLFQIQQHLCIFSVHSKREYTVKWSGYLNERMEDAMAIYDNL